MNLQEINFEQAKLLKQAGFVEHTTKFYDKNGVLTGSLPVNHNLHKDRFSCCTIALAIQWLREQKDMSVDASHDYDSFGTKETAYRAYILSHTVPEPSCIAGKYETWGVLERINNIPTMSAAESLGLDKALEILTTTPCPTS